MSDLKHEEILGNSASLETGNSVASNACDCCEDPLLFAMRDNHHDFSIGLFTILDCLKLAESEGAVPRLPEDWWIRLANQYRLKFHQLE